MTPPIETVGVGKAYGEFVRSTTSRQDRARRARLIVGPNGAGKTPRQTAHGVAEADERPRALKGEDIAGIGPVSSPSAAWHAPSISYTLPVHDGAETIAVAVVSQSGKSLNLFHRLRSTRAARKVREVARSSGSTASSMRVAAPVAGREEAPRHRERLSRCRPVILLRAPRAVCRAATRTPS